MSDLSRFQWLIERVRTKDPQAAAELVARYETELRNLARARMNNPRLRRTIDSVDIVQSIFGEFFERASGGDFQIDTPEQLVKLLSTMVRNRVVVHARRQSADRRDAARTVDSPVEELPIADDEESPSQIAASRELAQVAQQLFDPEERRIAGLRAFGQSWEEIAAEVGGSPEVLRRKMVRAFDRVAKKLGLIGPADN